MKAIILSGGLGTRLGEETIIRPKPMVEIGGYPILWHIMKLYSAYGVQEFVPTLGYKGEVITNYFLNYLNHNTNLSINLQSGQVTRYTRHREEWIVHLLQTGKNTTTGGRIRQALEFIGRERVFATYGDGLADIDIGRLLEFHKAHGKLATVTAVHPPARFGDIEIGNDDTVVRFSEKPQVVDGWINGGFFVLEPGVLDYIDGDIAFESEPMNRLTRDGELKVYRHEGFWQPMDVIREKVLLEDLWNSGRAPWKVWEDA
jgi:glucose-1-phosphate cytidylyltransferase